MKPKTMITAGILTLGLSSMTMAESAKFDHAQIDTDTDGYISQAEAQAHSAQRFDTIDSDGDQEVSLSEFKLHSNERAAKRAQKKGREIKQGRVEKRATRMFERLDKDGDGTLTQAEFSTFDFEKLVSRLDKDGDGRISVAELQSRRAKRAHY